MARGPVASSSQLEHKSYQAAVNITRRTRARRTPRKSVAMLTEVPWSVEPLTCRHRLSAIPACTGRRGNTQLANHDDTYPVHGW